MHFQKKNTKPEKNKQDQSKFFYNQKVSQEFFIWGRRTVETYLTELQNSPDPQPAQYALHLIVDKMKKAPTQLKPSVEFAQSLGIKIISHTSTVANASTPLWPLGEHCDELNHQRICLKIPQYPTKHLENACETIKTAVQNHTHGCIGIVLDQIQDPRNFGAILRNAAFFGLKFVAYATDRQANLSTLVLKTSAGGAFLVDLIPTTNISRALEQMKQHGAWIVGSALTENTTPLKQLTQDRTWVLILGNEQKGIRPEVLKKCDFIVKIPGGQSTVSSLNVSVAAGVLLHQLTE
jgi:23S rRNA (guanosine2251-2'-O)-methyltransferase